MRTDRACGGPGGGSDQRRCLGCGAGAPCTWRSTAGSTSPARSGSTRDRRSRAPTPRARPGLPLKVPFVCSVAAPLVFVGTVIAGATRTHWTNPRDRGDPRGDPDSVHDGFSTSNCLPGTILLTFFIGGSGNGRRCRSPMLGLTWSRFAAAFSVLARSERGPVRAGRDPSARGGAHVWIRR